ncbi:hypothetical protein HF521_007656 [Silurus meridionalis]|uniref:Podocalyxin n=1 Tax=Silurus meridionalis TaxID=175797 RepID=A0A8T0APL3_SILME|nr:hypothetical protein HF521_007656 [Silurus meridionalis]
MQIPWTILLLGFLLHDVDGEKPTTIAYKTAVSSMPTKSTTVSSVSTLLTSSTPVNSILPISTKLPLSESSTIGLASTQLTQTTNKVTSPNTSQNVRNNSANPEKATTTNISPYSTKKSEPTELTSTKETTTNPTSNSATAHSSISPTTLAPPFHSPANISKTPPTDSNTTSSTASSPNITTPTTLSPNITTPTAGSPNITTPTAGSPNITTPTAGSLNITTPTAGSPNITTPTAGSPNITTPTAGHLNTPTATLTPEISTQKSTIGFNLQSTPAEKISKTEKNFNVTVSANKNGKYLESMCARLMEVVNATINCTMVGTETGGNYKFKSLHIFMLTETQKDKDSSKDNTKDRRNMLIAVGASCGALMFILFAFGIYCNCHRLSYRKNQQHLTEELQTVENGYHDNPTLEVMEVQPEMQEKKLSLNGEFNDSWIVPYDNLCKDIPDEEDTHL